MANDTLAAATGIGPIVETVSGKLRGSLDNGIHIFKGRDRKPPGSIA
jgi:hypothetical protein